MDSHQVLKREIQLRKFKDLIGFIQGFMSQTASHIANTNGKDLWGSVQNGRIYRQKGVEKGSLLQRVGCLRGGCPLLGEGGGLSGKLLH